jgi:hypothetical protein
MQARPEISPELFAILDRLAGIGRARRLALQASNQATADSVQTPETGNDNENLKPNNTSAKR